MASVIHLAGGFQLISIQTKYKSHELIKKKLSVFLLDHQPYHFRRSGADDWRVALVKFEILG